MKLTIVSGMSGSGKTVALQVLEDLEYYCIDNLPLGLLSALSQQLNSDPYNKLDKIAVGIDARNIAGDLSAFPDIIEQLKAQGIHTETFFLVSNEETLLKRFSETRRKHPLSGSGNELGLADAIHLERQKLDPVYTHADLKIDTSRTTIHQLRRLLIERVSERKGHEGMSLMFQSFGFKHGIPTDADFVFDVRCLPNPHWEAHLRPLTGQDADVASFLERHESVDKMYLQIQQFLEQWLPQFELDNRSYMTVAIGCTGGQHRSVYFAERLGKHFQTLRQQVLIRHREMS